MNGSANSGIYNVILLKKRRNEILKYTTRMNLKIIVWVKRRQRRGILKSVASRVSVWLPGDAG